MVGMIVKKQSSQWWWLDNPNKSNSARSSWLQSTLSELDHKADAMRRLIEADADSFAQRAEMYYKKRPELIGMVEEFYRAHRSLAEKYHLLKSESGTRVLTTLSSPYSYASSSSSSAKFGSEKTDDDASEICESISDPDRDDDDEEEEEFVTPLREGPRRRGPDWSGIRKLKKEIERLEEDNRGQREMLKLKDEEKREVIRHLSLAVDMLKEDNVKLRNSLLLLAKDADSPPRKRTPFQFNVFKDGLFGKFFNGSQEYYPVVAL